MLKTLAIVYAVLVIGVLVCLLTLRGARAGYLLLAAVLSSAAITLLPGYPDVAPIAAAIVSIIALYRLRQVLAGKTISASLKLAAREFFRKRAPGRHEADDEAVPASHNKVSGSGYYQITLFNRIISAPKSVLILVILSFITLFIANSGSFFVESAALNISDPSTCRYCHTVEPYELENSKLHSWFKCTTCHTISEINITSETDMHATVTQECISCHAINITATKVITIEYINASHGRLMEWGSTDKNSTIGWEGYNEACVACHTQVNVNATIEFYLYGNLEIHAVQLSDMTWNITMEPRNASIFSMSNKTF